MRPVLWVVCDRSRPVGCCMIARVVGGIGFESFLPMRGPLLLLGWDRN